MRRWGSSAERKNLPSGWDVFEDAVAQPAGAALLPPTTSFVDDVLGEIDDLLTQQEFLIGFWQAPGE